MACSGTSFAVGYTNALLELHEAIVVGLYKLQVLVVGWHLCKQLSVREASEVLASAVGMFTHVPELWLTFRGEQASVLCSRECVSWCAISGVCQLA